MDQYFDKNQPRTEREHKYNDHIKLLENDNNEYQKTLEVLKDKFKDFEKKLGYLVQENEDLKDLLRRKQEQKQNADELQRLQNENQKLQGDQNNLKDTIYEKDKRIQNLHNDNQDKQAEINNLRDRIRTLSQNDDDSQRLRNLLNQRENDIQNLQDHYKLKENEVAKLRNRIENMQDQFNEERKADIQKMNQMDTKIMQQANEIKRLNELNDFKDKEVEIWKKKYDDLEKHYQEKMNQTLHQLEEEIKDRLDKEREDYRQKFEKQIKDLQENLKENEEKIVILITENERINNNNYEQAQEIRALREKLANAGDTQRSVAQLNNKIQEDQVKQVMLFIEIERLYLIQAELLEELDNFNKAYAKLMDEHDKLKRNSADASIIKDLREKIQDLQDSNAALMENNRELSDQSIRRLNEIEALKKNLSALESGDVTPKNDGGRLSIVDLQEAQMNFAAQKESLEQEIENLKRAEQNALDQIQKLRQLNNQRKQECEDLKKLLETQSSNPDLTHQYQMLQDQYDQAKKELENVRKNRDMYKSEYEKAKQHKLGQLNDLVRESIRLGERNSIMGNNSSFQSGHKDSYQPNNSNNITNTTSPGKPYY